MSELCYEALNALAEVTMGQSPDASAICIEGPGLPFLQGCAEFGSRNPTAGSLCFPALRVAKAGSVLISVRAPVGAMNHADQDYCIGRGLGAYIARQGLSDTAFLKHAVELGLPWLHRRSQGSTFAAISTNDLRRMPVPAFPLVAQQRIAAILTSLDAAIEKTEALIEKHQQIKAGLMHDLFTRGVLLGGEFRPERSQAPELYRQERCGWMPREWAVRRLGEISTVSRGKFTHRPRNDPAYLGGPYPFIQTGDVTAASGDFIDEFAQTLSAKGAAVSACFPPKTIAVTIAANIADTAILAMPMYFPDSVVGVVVGPDADTRFVELSIRRAKPRLDASATQSAQKNINLQDLRPLELPLPPINEQRAIAAIYDAVQRPIQGLGKVALKLRAQKLGLMQDLLTGKVPVKLPEPATVPA